MLSLSLSLPPSNKASSRISSFFILHFDETNTAASLPPRRRRRRRFRFRFASSPPLRYAYFLFFSFLFFSFLFSWRAYQVNDLMISSLSAFSFKFSVCESKQRIGVRKDEQITTKSELLLKRNPILNPFHVFLALII